ncbi:MAG: hypothetical protein HY200_00415 [Nitrospirae bacterium]|nr:hypothetical protein [Nitrospirota bacterium]MBI3593400.1 hypothetical protein [Nitrospirota bacterium]
MKKQEFNVLNRKIVRLQHGAQSSIEMEYRKVNDIWYVEEITDTELFLLNVTTGSEKCVKIENVETFHMASATQIKAESGMTFKISEDHYALMLNDKPAYMVVS